MTLFYLSIPQVGRTIRHVYSRRKNFAKLKAIEVKLGRILTCAPCACRVHAKNSRAVYNSRLQKKKYIKNLEF